MKELDTSLNTVNTGKKTGKRLPTGKAKLNTAVVEKGTEGMTSTEEVTPNTKPTTVTTEPTTGIEALAEDVKKAKVVKSTDRKLKKFRNDAESMAQLKRLLDSLYTTAEDYRGQFENVAEIASDYYNMRKPGVAVTGGAGYIAPVVQEKVNDLHTQLMDIALKIRNNFSVETKDLAAQLPANIEAGIATLIENSLFGDEDEAVLDAVIKSALITGTSYTRHYTDACQDYELDYFKELTEQEFEYLRTQHPDKTMEITKEESTPYGKLFTGQISKSILRNKVRYDHVVFSDVYVDPMARSIKNANYICVKSYSTRQDLIENGYDKSIVESLTVGDDLEAKARLNTGVDYIPSYGSMYQDSYVDKGLDVLEVKEHFFRTTLIDGKFNLFVAVEVGDTILDIKEEDAIPLSAFRPLANADSFYGVSAAYSLRSQQDAKTAMMRGFIDNVHNANHGSMTAMKGQYNKRDMMDNRPRRIVEIDVPGAIQPFPYNPLPNGIDLLMNTIDTDSDNISGVSNEMLGRGESAFATGITAAQVAISHSKSDLTIKRVAAGIVSGLKSLCKGLYNEYRKEFTELPKVNTFKFSVETETGRRSKSTDIMAAFQTMSQVGMMTPQLQEAMAKEYMKNIGMADLVGLIKPIDQFVQEQQAASQPKPVEQLQTALLQAQIQGLTADAQLKVQKAEVDAIESSYEQNRANAKFEVDQDIELKKLELEERRIALEEYEAGVRTQVAIVEANANLQQAMATGEEITLAAAKDVLTKSPDEKGL